MDGQEEERTSEGKPPVYDTTSSSLDDKTAFGETVLLFFICVQCSMRIYLLDINKLLVIEFT